MSADKRFTDNCLGDFIDNNGYHDVYDDKEELYMLKTLKLAFYEDVNDDLKAEYLGYYLEVHPVFASKYNLAGEEEKERLLAKAITKAEIAKDDFIKHNIRLVINLAKKYHYNYNYIELIDLIQMGNIGLCIALENFDLKRNLKFSTYAVWWIKERMHRLSLNERPMRFPSGKVSLFNKLLFKSYDYYEENGHYPSNETLISWGATKKTLDEYNLYITNLLRLDEPLAEDSGLTLSDAVESMEPLTEEIIEEKIINEELRYLLDNVINDKTRVIIERFYGFNGEPEPMKSIAADLGETPEKLKYMRVQALKTLKKYLTTSGTISKVKKKK